MEIINPNFLGCVHGPARLHKQRRHMAGGTLCIAIEQFLASARCFWIKAAFWCGWRRDSKLVEMQRCESWCDQVIFAADIAKTSGCGNRELFWVIKPRIVECPLTMHL